MNQLPAIAATALLAIGAIDLAAFPVEPPDHAEADDHAPVDHPEARPFDSAADAMAAVDAALQAASVSGKNVILIMGANWCHDSRGLAGHLASDDFSALVEPHFEIVHVDAGKPREDDTHNLHVARRFGVDALIGTPNVFMLSPEGELLNDPEDVTGWTDAASRDPDDIKDFLRLYLPAR